MKQRDIAVLMEGIAPVIVAAIAKAMQPVAERVEALEKRFGELPPVASAKELAAMAVAHNELQEMVLALPMPGELPAMVGKAVAEALPKVPTAEEVAALIPVPTNGRDGADGKDGRDGVDGKSVAIDEVAPMVADQVAAAFAGMPLPKDGRDGRDGQDGAPGEKGDQGEPGPKGDPGERGEKGDRGEPGIVGERGDRGEAGAQGNDGAPGTRGERGEKGEPGQQGERGERGLAGADGVGLAGAVIDRAGELNLTLTDGTVVKLGVITGKDGAPGKDGRDGLGFDDIEIVDDGMSFTLRLQRGDHVKEWSLSKPTMADMYKGVWAQGAFERGAVVTWAGSLWLAKADTEAKPETTDDWVLVTKRGRDGRDGELKAPREPATVKLK